MSVSLQNPDFIIPPRSFTKWLLLLIILIVVRLHQTHALNPGAVSITNKSGPSFLLDANSPCGEGPEASYVAYKICNTSAGTLTGLTANLGGLAAGFNLQSGQPATLNIGNLAAGECTMAFWYVKFPCTFNQTTNITITVADTNPGTVSATNQVKTTSNLTAAAGGLLVSMAPGPALVIGGTTWFDIEYEFGNIPKNGIAYFQPAGNPDFNASCLQLLDFEVVTSDIPNTIAPGSGDALYFIAPEAAGGGEHRVKVRYHFTVNCEYFITTLKPFAAATSGSPVKYSSNYGAISVTVPGDFPAATVCDGNFNDFATQIIGTGTGLEGTQDNWSASWGDYDGDGFPDIFVTTHDTAQPNALYHNNGDGTFTKITSGAIATDLASSLASTWGDYDNDGDLDLFVANNIGYPNFLYRNEGGGSFTKIQNDAIVADLGYAHGASWADYDNDGFLDLFVGSYFETLFNILYHNNGDGTFTRVTNNPVVNEASTTITGVWGDYDNDGLVDLFVANRDGANNSLYRNTGNGTFQKITSGAIVNDGGNSVGASWGDYDNDADLDLFVCNAGGENNFLYENNGNGSFTKVTSGIVVNDGGHSHGSAWADWDNDGDLDLFVSNDGQNNSLYRNDGNGAFTKISNAITSSVGLSFGCAWADFDRDGDVDLFVANRDNTSNFLYKNTKGNCNNWTCISLRGTRSNASAIGARVIVKAMINGQIVTQIREISAQTGGGTGGQNDLTANLGLGNASSIDSVIVEWPSGYRQVLANQPTNQCISITEDYASEVCGAVYYDANSNCQQDAGEMGIPNTKIVLQPGNITVYTDENGHYSVFVKPGTYGIQEFPGANWDPHCPNLGGTSAVTVTGIGNQFCGYNFGNTALCSSPELKVELATTANRIGFENLLVINFENLGASVSTGTVLDVTLDPQMIPMESTLPWDSYTDRHLVWNLPDLVPGAKGAIYVTFEVVSNTPIGDNLLTDATLIANESDCEPANNSFQEMAIAIGALDPNDMLVNPEGAVEREQWLVYRIRFQNVGNAPVSTVKITDELPAGLDLSTLEMGIASHPYHFQADGRELAWIFPNIGLPDSLHNEPESHGFVTFRIKLKKDLPAGETVINSAAIYFDNMPAVLTNEVVNFLDYGQTNGAYSHNSLRISPNPASGEVTVRFRNNAAAENLLLQSLTVFDLYGRPVLQESGTSSHFARLNLSELHPGHYVIKGLDNRGRQHLGRIVVVR